MAEESRSDERPHTRMPGCGLAAFAMLLLSILGVGLCGVSVSTYSVFASYDQLRPTRLSYGGVVDPATLAPMREAGLLGAEEIPDAFHAESSDGYEACAISGGRVLQITRVGKAQMPFTAIESVEADESGVTIVGTKKTIRCPFGAEEGADRFARMLQAR